MASASTRPSYGVLILVPDHTLRHQARTPEKIPSEDGVGGGSYVLCVKHYLSIEMRNIIFELRTGGSKENITKLGNSLGARELSILLSKQRFNEIVGKAYWDRPHLITKIRDGYSRYFHLFKSFRSERGLINERRWSPPKGGSTMDETRLETIYREVEEETGLSSDTYQILDSPPIILEYSIRDNYTFKLVLYLAELREVIHIPRMDESSMGLDNPKPKNSSEIERVALIPLLKMFEYFPFDYGTAIQTELVERLKSMSFRTLETNQ